MQRFKPLLIALSTFTIVPMPQVEWDEKNLRKSVWFLPVAGLFPAVALLLWTFGCTYFALPAFLYGVGAALLPVLLTGGIHLDGFMDTLDALASRQPRARKLEILKDSACGAFAVMGCVFYALLTAALFAASYSITAALVVCAGFVLSRCLSVFHVLTMPNARGNGMLQAMSAANGKRPVSIMVCLCGFCAAAMCAISLPMAAFALLLAGAHSCCYRSMANKQFGGVTGDTAGYFLTSCELFIVIGVTAGGLWM